MSLFLFRVPVRNALTEPIDSNVFAMLVVVSLLFKNKSSLPKLTLLKKKIYPSFSRDIKRKEKEDFNFASSALAFYAWSVSSPHCSDSKSVRSKCGVRGFILSDTLARLVRLLFSDRAH